MLFGIRPIGRSALRLHNERAFRLYGCQGISLADKPEANCRIKDTRVCLLTIVVTENSKLKLAVLGITGYFHSLIV